MPRLPPQLFRRALRISPDLATLLPACRDLRTAANELRWIRQHVDENARTDDRRRYVSELCQRRGRHEPLQYVLGSQPFGSLDIKCKPKVLIPRPETEAYTYHLISKLKSGALLNGRTTLDSELKIIDFCTGTGCIPLLLFAELQRLVPNLAIRGVDVSSHALRIAQQNIAHNVKLNSLCLPSPGQQLSFEKADLFNDGELQAIGLDRCDIMVSNPPYISNDTWDNGRGDLGCSVRKYEPRLALVPGNHLPPAPPGLCSEDIFYSRLLEIAVTLQTKALLLEIGDSGQAHRVLRYIASHEYGQGSHIELWRDWPDAVPSDGEPPSIEMATEGFRCEIPIRGSGNLRSILVRTQKEGN